MAYWRFGFFSGHTPELRAMLEDIPGVKTTDTTAAAPRNAAWLVRDLLTAAGVTFSMRSPKDHPARGAKASLPWLQPWVPDFLTPYQRQGIASILSIPGECGHAWWSAGSGKTLAGIVWALAAGPGLTIVVTKAAIRGTWAREIDTYTKGCKWEILEGRNVEEKWTGGSGSSFSDAQPTFIVTGYDTLPNWIGVLERLKPRSVIFDEIHHVRSTKRWDAVVDLGAEAQSETDDTPAIPTTTSASAPLPEPKVSFSLKDNRAAAAYLLSRATYRRLGLTATPISDRLRDLWAQLDLVHPWEFGAFSKFANRYCNAIENGWGGVDTRGTSNVTELKKRTDYVTHRVPFSVANRNLPPKRRLVTYVKLSEQVKAEGFAEDLRRAMRGVQSSSEGRARLLEMLLMESAARKRKIVEAWVNDAIDGEQKIIVFTGRRRDCARMAEEIGSAVKSRRKEALIFSADGSVPLGDPRSPAEGTRYWIMDRYMEAPGPALLIGTGDAWGEGLNLQDTDLLINAMLPYTPRQIIQWEGRVARLGQKRPVLIRYPICEGTVDERVATILMNKIPAIEKTIQSDEIAGLGQELVGASEEELIGSLLDKVLGETE